MAQQFKLIPNSDGSYDIQVNFDYDTEFSLDFFSKEGFTDLKSGIIDFAQKASKDIKINAVRIAVAGILVSSVAFSTLSIYADAATRYTMSFLYAGTVSQQIGYVDNTQKSLDVASPSNFDLNDDGSLILNNVSKTLVDSLHARNVKVVPFLSNHWDRAKGVNALKNKEKLSTDIANAIATYNLDGVNVDIENVTHTERDAYTELVRLLRQKIPANKEVSVSVAANPYGWNNGWQGSYDYAALGKVSDHLMIMTYDEHYEGGDAGPVASNDFVENSIKYALQYVPASKIVLGIPFFGRVWSDSGFNGQGIAISRVDEFQKNYNGKITYDKKSESPKLEFTVSKTDNNVKIVNKALTAGKYTIWYENDQSIKNKLSFVSKYDLKGSGSWSLGNENKSIWDFYSTIERADTYPSDSQSTPAPSTAVPKAPAPAPAPVKAQSKVVFSKAKTAIYTKASSTSKKITTVKKGTKMTYLSTTASGWHKIKINGKTGYIKKTKGDIYKVKKVTASKLNVRAGASNTKKKVGTVSKGKTVYEKKNVKSWSMIRFGSSHAYVSKLYVK